MHIYVINLDTQKANWRRLRQAILELGDTPHRFPATEDDGICKLWTGTPVPDRSRRRAITHSYQRLVTALINRDDLDDTRYGVLQDDVHLNCDTLDRPNAGLIHVYGGWRNYAMRLDTDGHLQRVPGTLHLSKGHICPLAFSAHRSILPDLLKVWSNETRSVCDSWLPIVNRLATFDSEPTCEPIYEP